MWGGAHVDIVQNRKLVDDACFIGGHERGGHVGNGHERAVLVGRPFICSDSPPGSSEPGSICWARTTTVQPATSMGTGG